MNRREYAGIIEQKLKGEVVRLRDEFHQHAVQSCFIDNLLPEDEALKIFEAFPDKSSMMLKKSLRENKYVAAQMDKYTPILEEIIYAFQDQRVLKVVEEITGIVEMVPDEHLYAGGVSLMAKDNFLNPPSIVCLTFSTMSRRRGPMRWVGTWSFGTTAPKSRNARLPQTSIGLPSWRLIENRGTR